MNAGSRTRERRDRDPIIQGTIQVREQKRAEPGLPLIADKELAAMNELMADKKYRIKQPSGFLRHDRTDRVSPEFVLYTLNDYLGHLQRFVALTRQMLPPGSAEFYKKLHHERAVAAAALRIVRDIDIRTLSKVLQILQTTPKEISVSDLVPFTRMLFRPLIQLYYLGGTGLASLYKEFYRFTIRELGKQKNDNLKSVVTGAVEEWFYVVDQLCPGMYPLVLRMVSQTVMTSEQLFYANGSKVLAWLEVSPSEILFMESRPEVPPEVAPEAAVDPAEPELVVEASLVPEPVREGLDALEKFFPEAGWNSLESMPDFCSYFQPILQTSDAFTQLAPENPLHLTLVLLGILEQFFQGLRLIKFERLDESFRDEAADINKILEDWILYEESVFEKNFSNDLKEFTHQIYTQPEYSKNPYGRRLLSNMYTLIKATFLPHFDIHLYGTTRMQKDDRLPPFYLRVAHLKEILGKYQDSINAAPPGSDANPDGFVPGVLNPWVPYKFDIPNPVSRRLDALLGGKHAKGKTNAVLIRSTLSVLNVLDWWVNDVNSFAYRNPPKYLYRVVAPDNPVPAFGVNPRTDVDELFTRHLKIRPVPPLDTSSRMR